MSPSPIYQFRIDQFPDIISVLEPSGLSFTTTIEYSSETDPIWSQLNSDIKDHFFRKGLHIKDANFDADFYRLPWVLLHIPERANNSDEFKFKVDHKIIGQTFSISAIKRHASKLPNHLNPEEPLVVLGQSIPLTSCTFPPEHLFTSFSAPRDHHVMGGISRYLSSADWDPTQDLPHPCFADRVFKLLPGEEDHLAQCETGTCPLPEPDDNDFHPTFVRLHHVVSFTYGH
jgi:hypothetical protein